MSPCRSVERVMRCALAAVFVLLSPLSMPASQRSGRADAPIVLTPPARRAPDVPPPVARALPRAADHVTPLTLEVLVRRQSHAGAAQSLRQTITRTSAVVHIAADHGREWFFERNRLDSRRVAGYLVQHASRSIVFYDESDLRNMVGIDGWADVLTLGIDATELHRMSRSSESRTLGEVQFSRYVAREKNAHVTEVWWSEAEALPRGFTIVEPQGSTRVSIERIRRAINPDVLRTPGVRFPDYRSLDLADWLEGH